MPSASRTRDRRGRLAPVTVEEAGSMDTATFDTLTAAHTLEAAGIERGHAEAIAHAIRNGQGDLATKGDITTVKADITTVRGEITAVKGEIAAVASRVNALQWVVGIQSAITLATFAIVAAKLL